METTDLKELIVMPVPRKDGTVSLRLCLTQGALDRNMLRKVMDVMDAFDLHSLRATTGQRMNLEGITPDKVDQVVNALGATVPSCPPGISVCPGGGICKLGQQETRDFGIRLQELLKQHAPFPFKIKSGISGCRMACGMSYVRDIGLIATAKGWELRFGGCATAKARSGVLLASDITEDEALALIEKAVLFYKENGKKRERTSAMVERMGEDALLKAVQ